MFRCHGHLRIVQHEQLIEHGDICLIHGYRLASTQGGFNRSMQQLDGIVQPVYRSLVSCVDVR